MTFLTEAMTAHLFFLCVISRHSRPKSVAPGFPINHQEDDRFEGCPLVVERG